jgi:hypothetical protein
MPHRYGHAMDAHVSTVRRLRLAALAFIVAWFFVPDLHSSIPAWLPFFALLALEVNFLVAGWRERGAPRGPRGRTPQETDIAEFGGKEWLQPELHEVGGYQVWIPEQLEEEEPQPAAARARGWSLWEGAALLAAVGLLLFVFAPDRGWGSLSSAEQARTEARLSAEAARIAGHPAEVRCDAKGKAVGVVQHADGLAQIGGTRAFLTPGICFRLHQLAFDGEEGPFSQTARAIAVLAHEAWHLHGERDEGVTNCYAYQSGVVLGERLGLSHGTAARMMRQQLTENALLARAAPEYLVPPGCHDGGSLDLSPATSRFP